MYMIGIPGPMFLTLSGKYKQSYEWDHNGWRQRYNVLVYVISGRCSMTIHEDVYYLAENDAILIPADTLYTPNTDSQCEYYYFHFDAQITKVSDEACRRDIAAGKPSYKYCEDILESEIPAIYMNPVMHIGQGADRIRQLIESIHYDMTSIHYYSKLSMNIKFIQLLTALSQCGLGQSFAAAGSSGFIEQMIHYIHNNLGPELTLERISDHFGYSKQHIIKQFKAGTATTPTRYINDLKLMNACGYMQDTTMNISEIAYISGFTDVNYFSRIFKRKYGIPPTRFRRQGGGM